MDDLAVTSLLAPPHRPIASTARAVIVCRPKASAST
jgi:hypothetical protein